MLDDPRMQRAVLDHLSLADSIAWRHARRLPAIDTDELLSISREALVRAAARWVVPYCSDRGFNPWSEDDPSVPEAHFAGLAAKTCQGAILDHLRKLDFVTRQDRKRIKQVQTAIEGGARSPGELSAATDLTAGQIRAARAAEAVKPCSLDDTGADWGGSGSLADSGPGVESQVIATELTAVFLSAFDSLPGNQRIVLSLVYHGELELPEVAGKLGITAEAARKLHNSAVTAVHQSLLRAASADGSGPHSPSPPILVSSSDSCRAAESGSRLKRCAGCGEKFPAGMFSYRDRARDLRVPYCKNCASLRAAAAYRKRRESALTG